MEKKTWHFDFLVEGITKKEAELLLEQIQKIVYYEWHTTKMAGGFHDESEHEDGEETEPVPQGS